MRMEIGKNQNGFKPDTNGNLWWYKETKDDYLQTVTHGT